MKRLNIKRLLLVATLLTSASAYSNEYSKSYEACMQQAVSTLDIVTCISNEYERQDQRLNDNYQQLRGHLSDERRDQLLSVQRIWITYKEANCGFYADPEGGTMARINANSCLLSETTRRADELENLMQP
ncbi:lysozyme inhibitor LprI family protein [Halomonas sp.]|uniref:lysozyme inhibitor LprI family protein n=1 Tax=Halomonas sp. TaxID=1486246 RepID=UPI003F8FE3FC|tara:strand:- start:6673 stop:7062 length:390 start_codon:yes stop_codon:yes gene_type:complete